jgi:transcriptional regulator with XRE-family HTH domain
MISHMSTPAAAPELERLAAAVRTRRAELDMTQDQLAQRADVSVNTVRGIEQGGPHRPRSANALKLEAALGWQRGSIRAILAGGEPVLDEPGGGRRRIYADPAEQHIADTPGLSEDVTTALIEFARALRRNQEQSSGTG